MMVEVSKIGAPAREPLVALEIIVNNTQLLFHIDIDTRWLVGDPR